MRYLTYVFPLLLLFFTACGGGSDTQNQTKSSTDNQSATNQSSDVRTIHIIGIDQMKYVVDDESQEGITTGAKIGNDGMIKLEAISAEPGEEIRIRLTTKSDLPAAAMAHNVVILTLEADASAFANAASKARDNEYIPADMESHIIAYSDLAAGGETVEFTFTAPEETGDYPFICSFPGHYAADMTGTLNIK